MTDSDYFRFRRSANDSRSIENCVTNLLFVVNENQSGSNYRSK